MNNKYSDYQYLLAYGAIILIILLVIKSRVGYVTVYYALALFAFTLFLLSSNILVKILAPISQP